MAVVWHLLIVVLSFFFSNASGHAVNPVPVEHVDSSRLAEDLRKNLPRPLRSHPDIEVKEPKQLETPESSRDLRFKLKRLNIEGSTVFNKKILESTYREPLGKDVSLNELYGVAASINQAYRDEGYTLSQVVIPSQKIADGTVLIKVWEGFVDEITITANQVNSQTRALIQDYAYHISDSRPIHISKLERYALLANDLPGIDVQTFLQPAKQQMGAADLIMAVRSKRYEALVSIDNYMSERYGQYTLTAAGYINNLFAGSRTGLIYKRALLNNSLNVYSVSHTEQIGDEGLKLNLTAQHVKSLPDIQVNGIVNVIVDSSSSKVTLNLMYPWIRSQKKTVTLQGGLEVQDAKTSQKAVQHGASTQIRKTDDRLRSLVFSLIYESVDELYGSNVMSLELSQGLRGFGSSAGIERAKRSRSGGRADYTKFDLDISRLQWLSSRWSVLFSFEGQYSFHELLSPEEFGLGGRQVGRGYDGSEIVGEHGIGSKLELQYSRAVSSDFVSNFQLYSFFDVGCVWNMNPEQERRQSLASTGIGLKLNFKRFMLASIEYAKPLTRVVVTQGNKDPRVFMKLSMWI